MLIDSLENIKKNTLKILKTIDCPEFCKNPVYLTICGSIASGLSNQDSDIDMIGVCIPPEEYINPWKYGYIPDFEQVPTFQQFQKHGLVYNNKEYDITIYNISRYFKLCLDGNINIIETLFTNSNYHIICNSIGDIILQHKQDFLSMNCYYKFMGFANAHKKRLENRRGREDYINKFGWDCKEGAFLIRAYHQCLNLLDRKIIVNLYPDLIKKIKNGEYKYEDILDEANLLNNKCEIKKQQSLLQEKPNMVVLKMLLKECLQY